MRRVQLPEINHFSSGSKPDGERRDADGERVAGRAAVAQELEVRARPGLQREERNTWFNISREQGAAERSGGAFTFRVVGVALVHGFGFGVWGYTYTFP